MADMGISTEFKLLREHITKWALWPPAIIARPKGPKDGLFRLHASWIYLSYAGFDSLAAILCH